MTLSLLDSWLQTNRMYLDFGKKELKPDGSVDEYKALLVVKGFRQREKI